MNKVNQMTVYDIIMQLRDTSSRNEKESILKANANNVDLKKALAMAYNQLTNFYISSVTPTTSGTQHLDDEGYSILMYANARELSGHDLVNKVTEYCNKLTPEDQEVFKCVVERDFKAGITATTLTKIWPDEPAFKDFKVMLCDDFEKHAKSVTYPVMVQVKYDASRVIVIVDRNDNVTYRTRNGRTYQVDNKTIDTDFIMMKQTLANKWSSFRDGVVFDGEIYQIENGKILDRQTSNGVATKLIRGTASKAEQDKIGITIWDCVRLKEFISDKPVTIYGERWDDANIHSAPDVDKYVLSGKIKYAETYVAHTEKEVYEIANNMIESRGEEGVIVKNPFGKYERKRTKNCLKVKEVNEADLKVIGLTPGEGKYEGKLGSLVCQDKSGKVTVSVGSGLTDAQRDEFDASIIGKIVSVKYNMVIDNYDKTGKTLSLIHI